MNSTAASNTSSNSATDSSRIVPSTAEGIALCTAFILSFVLIIVGNLLTIVLFAVNKKLRKRSLFLVINMALVDLMLGTVPLPIYIYSGWTRFQLWKDGSSMSLLIFYTIVNMFFSQASLISAAFISGETRFTVDIFTFHFHFYSRMRSSYKTLNFSGPFRRVRPAKLISHSARTILEI